MITDAKKLEARDRIDQLFTGFKMGRLQRPNIISYDERTIPDLQAVKDEIDAIIALLSD